MEAPTGWGVGSGCPPFPTGAWVFAKLVKFLNDELSTLEMYGVALYSVIEISREYSGGWSKF